MPVKLRRDRDFGEEGRIQSQLPSAQSPASRVVSSGPSPSAIAHLGDVKDRIIWGDSLATLKAAPNDAFACTITSPPYWNMVDYGIPGQIGQGSYESYRLRLTEVWKEVARTLQPNGKFCLNVPILPIKKAVSAEHFGKTHTRMLLDLPGDLKADILGKTDLLYYSFYVWEKQTTEKMFGSYPYPPNLLERNYCEFVLVFVKPGKPPKYSKAVKEAAKLTQEEWMELTKQVWWIYPENVKRKEGHPSPFPETLPNRLIRMYTFPEVPGEYEGDLVLDPFSGWGTTCVAAKRQGRHYTGIDLSQSFCKEAEERLAEVKVVPCVMTATKPKGKK